MSERTLSNGFEEFLTWSIEDFADALRSGLVVFDANVLLDLYRYDPEVRAAMLDVMRRLEGRLFVPHRVAVEFWRNRESALEDRAATATGVVERISSAAQAIEASVNHWRNRTGALSPVLQELLALVVDGVDKITDEIDSEAAETGHERDTTADEVLSALVDATSGHVGPAPSTEDAAKLVAEGLDRVARKVPPGYMDIEKDGDGPAGDFMVWRQTLDEAQSRDVRRILVVTSDQKEDWNHLVKGQRRGIRRELRREAMNEAGADVAVIAPSRLLELAEGALDVDVDVEAVSRLAAIGTQSDRDWDPENIVEFRDLVAKADPDRAAVLEQAIADDGYVSRRDVYRLCGYSDERTLRGFTRPYSRLKQELIRRGHLSVDAEDPMVAIYDDPRSYVLASGFIVPDAFLLRSSSEPVAEAEFE